MDAPELLVDMVFQVVEREFNAGQTLASRKQLVPRKQK